MRSGAVVVWAALLESAGRLPVAERRGALQLVYGSLLRDLYGAGDSALLDGDEVKNDLKRNPQGDCLQGCRHVAVAATWWPDSVSDGLIDSVAVNDRNLAGCDSGGLIDSAAVSDRNLAGCDSGGLIDSATVSDRNLLHGAMWGNSEGRQAINEAVELEDIDLGGCDLVRRVAVGESVDLFGG